MSGEFRLCYLQVATQGKHVDISIMKESAFMAMETSSCYLDV
jgi:hypothetical protein